MPPFPFSPLKVVMCAMLSLSSVCVVQAQDQNTEGSATSQPDVKASGQANTKSSGALASQSNIASTKQDVITVVGSQVTLGDAYAGGQVATTGRAGLLGNMDSMDTPFSSTNYTESLIREQQAKSVGDVLQNDPTVRVATGYGNFQELYMIRGFNVYSDDMTLNGVYGILPRQFVSAEMVERVEVFRGANTFLNGAAPGGSGIGGLVNIVPKRAEDQPLTRVTIGTQTGGQAYGALDYARRYGVDNSNGIRINLVARNGQGSIDNENTQLGAMMIDWDHQGDHFRLSADIGYQDHHIDNPRPSVTPSSSAPSAPDASSNYAQDFTYTDEKQLFGVVRGEYDFAADTTGWLAVGGRHGKEHNLLANPTASGSGSLTTYTYENVREDNIISADTGIRHEFTTGAVDHALVLSGSAYYATVANAYSWSSSYSIGSFSDYEQEALNTDILTFVGELSDPKITERDNNVSMALADTLGMMDDQLKVTLGGRLQRIEQTSYNYDGSFDSQYGKNAATPFAGVVYQPTMNVSLYTNYSEALVKGDIAASSHYVDGSYVTVTNAGQVFAPARSRQYEAGVKYDSGRFGTTVSVFQITKPTYTYEGNTYTDNGDQRNRGVELTGYGKVTDSVRVLGGVSLINAKLTHTENGTNDGNTAIGVPKVTANLNLVWDTPFVEGLSLEGRTVYTGSQYIDEANEYTIPAWTRLDVGASYTMKVDANPLTINARIENLMDRSYWASAGGYPGANYLVEGAPRTIMVSASYDF